jgi:hypothetical protein
MNRYPIAAALALALLAAPAAAHGPENPMYGGIVQKVSDLHFELVPHPGGAWLYVADHGKPVDSARLSGKLTVLNGTEKSEGALKPAGGNKLEAAGLRIAPGARVVALVTGTAANKPLTIRFSVK